MEKVAISIFQSPTFLFPVVQSRYIGFAQLHGRVLHGAASLRSRSSRAHHGLGGSQSRARASREQIARFGKHGQSLRQNGKLHER